MARPEITGRRRSATGIAASRRIPNTAALEITNAIGDVEPRASADASNEPRRSADRARGPPGETDLYSIAEFCRRHSINRSFYFSLRKKGLGPRELRLGKRVFVSKEAARQWVKEREAATAA
jgi:hypothetical protein